jgi:hypothetical protein
VSFHTFTLLEDRCAPLLLKNLGRGMPESVFREELEFLDIHDKGVMQLRSGRRDQDPTKDRPFTPHLIESVARGPEVDKVRYITELCGLRVSVESYVAQKARCNASAASASDTRSVTADTRPGASRVVASNLPVDGHPRGSSLFAVAAGATTQRVTGSVSSGKKRRRLLQIESQGCPKKMPPQANPLLLKPSEPDPLPSRWIWARAGIPSSEGGVLSRPPPLHRQILNPLSRSRRRPRSLK